MDTQRINEMIRKMFHSNMTVSSLTMFARKMGRTSPEALQAFLEIACEKDIFMTATVVHQSLGDINQSAREQVYRILAERCRAEEQFSHLELLAIAVCNDRQLLQNTAAFFTEQLIADTFALADGKIAGWLLRTGLQYLPETPCALIRQAFCGFLLENKDRMDEELAQLVPILPEYDASDVLSVLIDLAGLEQVENLYGGSLYPEVERMISEGKDSLAFWDIFFDHFFAQTHTSEELLVDGLWHVQMCAGEEIYDQVGALFYFYAATHCDLDEPVFAYADCFEQPQKYSRKYVARFKKVVNSLWDQPERLTRFLEKTTLCNPFCKDILQKDGYKLLKNAQDPVSYEKLTHLFDINATAEQIVNIFLSTDLKLSLPLEDVFCLAEERDMLPAFLEVFKRKPFYGQVANQKDRTFLLLPFTYFVTSLHLLKFPQWFLDNNHEDEQKKQEYPYIITSFRKEHIRITFYEAPESNEEKPLSWPEAVEELQNLLNISSIPFDQLRQLAVLQFDLNSFSEENDLNLLTDLIQEHPERLPLWIDVLKLCVWNTHFTDEHWKVKKRVYDALRQYYEPVHRLFTSLFTSGQDPDLVLKLYFSSVYKVILPLNMLLPLGDRDRLLALLPNYVIQCRLQNQDSDLCRPINILCGPVCSVENAEDITLSMSFAATVTDYVLATNSASRIHLQPCFTEVSIEERGTTFGFLSKNIDITERRAHLIKKFPSADRCSYGEMRLNLSCIEDAILLRRANNKALMQLLQILGNANPYTFQLSYMADRMYLKKFREKEEKEALILSAATTMVLNVKDIDAVRRIYLHTPIRFYMRLPALAQLICKRRPDLASQIPTMFNDTVFHAIADKKGSLWMPWIEQNTVQVAQKCAGQFLCCRLSLGVDGTIRITSIEAEESEAFFEVLQLCLLAGYESLPYMDAMLQSYLRDKNTNESTENTVSEVKSFLDLKLSFQENLDRLKAVLRMDPFPHKQLAKNISHLIRTFSSTVSAQDMQSGIGELTREWIQLRPNAPLLKKYWFGIHLCYANNYHTCDMGRVLIEQFYEHLYSRDATVFEMRVNDSCVELMRSFENKEPFESAYARTREILFADPFLHLEFARQVRTLMDNYRTFVPVKEMEDALLRLTAELLQLYPNEKQLKQPLYSIHQRFYNYYRSYSLGIALCQQFHRYLEGTTAFEFENSMRKALSKETGIQLTPEEEAFLHAAPILEIPKQSNEAASGASIPVADTHAPLENHLKPIAALLDEDPFQEKYFVRSITALIRELYTVVSAEVMEQAITELTAQWFRKHPFVTESKPYLVGVHSCFLNFYQSDLLGLALCKQAYAYLDTTTAKAVEKSIKSISLQAVNGQNVSTIFRSDGLETPATSRPPFETVLPQLQALIYDTTIPAGTFAKQLGKLIRKYNDAISAQEMEAHITDLTAQWIPLHLDEPQLETLLLGINASFATHYQSCSLGLAFCQQIKLYRNDETAQALEQRLRNSKEFLACAFPIM